MRIVAKSLVYKFIPASVADELRHRKHLRDLATVTEPDFPFITKYLHAGDTVLDIGANFGVFTKFFSSAVGSSGRVLAFEPIPSTFRTLSAGVRRYHLSNVEVRNCALSDRRQTVTMQAPRFASGGDNLYQAAITRESIGGLTTFSVPAMTVDSLNLPHADFMKIDVEGHEVEVLRGARETLLRFHPVLLVEVSHKEVAEFLALCGYRPPVKIMDVPNQLFLPVTET